jgi:pyruvate/2-oxoglutarate/acetoin dehydrogenase E1 component
VIDTPISEANIMGAAVGMALAGLRPVVEMRVIDFALCAMDEIVNQAAKNRYMFGGQGRVPLVARLPIGIWSASAAQHSQSLEAWFAHLPGLVVVTPGTAQDNFGLLKGAGMRRPGDLPGAQGALGPDRAGRHHAGRAAGPREPAARAVT